MNVWIFAGGDRLEAISKAVKAPPDLVIAADSGLLLAQALGVKVDILVGDFDSTTQADVDEARKGGAEILTFSTDKDATDLELSVQTALARGATSITMLGGHGGRLGHWLTNLALLAELPEEVKAIAQMGTSVVHTIKGRVTEGTLQGGALQGDATPSCSTSGRATPSQILLDSNIGKYVSLIPWGGDAEGVSTTGLRWELNSETLYLGSSRGVSNELVTVTELATRNELATNQATVSLKSGTLIVIHEPEI